MNFCQVSWEDEEKNREVLFRVEYTTKNSTVHVSAITPERVTFKCPETRQPVRSIRLWTDKARKMLVRQYEESGKLAEMRERLADRDAVANVA